MKVVYNTFFLNYRFHESICKYFLFITPKTNHLLYVLILLILPCGVTRISRHLFCTTWQTKQNVWKLFEGVESTSKKQTLCRANEDRNKVQQNKNEKQLKN